VKRGSSIRIDFMKEFTFSVRMIKFHANYANVLVNMILVIVDSNDAGRSM